MKENKNDTLLITLTEIKDLSKLTDDEQLKLATQIAKNININGLRRHINYTLMMITGATGTKANTTMNDNQKLELIKKLLTSQRIVETNVRSLKRKIQVAIPKNDIVTFISSTTEVLKTIKEYQKENEKQNEKQLKEDKKDKVKPEEIKKAESKKTAKK